MMARTSEGLNVFAIDTTHILPSLIAPSAIEPQIAIVVTLTVKWGLTVIGTGQGH